MGMFTMVMRVAIMLVIMMFMIVMMLVIVGMIVLMVFAMSFEGLGLGRMRLEFVVAAAVGLISLEGLSLEALRLAGRVGSRALDDFAADAIATAAAA